MKPLFCDIAHTTLCGNKNEFFLDARDFPLFMQVFLRSQKIVKFNLEELRSGKLAK